MTRAKALGQKTRTHTHTQKEIETTTATVRKAGERLLQFLTHVVVSRRITDSVFAYNFVAGIVCFAAGLRRD